MIASPIRWVGGKSRLRKFIIPLIPPDHTCYVELFAGGAWVLFGKEPSQVEVLNDIDQELVNFFEVLQTQPDDLMASFDWELVSRAKFDRLANSDPLSLDNIARAHRFYYLIMAGWGGESNYPRFQTSISDGGHGNRLIGALKRLQAKLMPVHKRLSTVIIEHLSWEECFDRYDHPNTVMYIDPPYPGNGCNYKHNMREWADHERLAERLTQARSRWILSSYDQPKIRAMYDSCHITAVQSFSGMSTKKGSQKRVKNQEAIITNYEVMGGE